MSANAKAGQIIRLRIVPTRDPISGRAVERLSDNTGDTVLSYFTREIVTPDNRGVLVASNRSGQWLPYLILPDGNTMRCLCARPMQSPWSPAIGGDRIAYVSADGRLGYIPIEGGEFEAVIELPPGRDYSHVGVSACGRYALLIYSEKLGPTVKCLRDGQYHSALSERLAFGPRCVMLHVNLETGITKGLTGGVGPFYHPMISPADPAWMEYCHGAGWHQCQRMWTIHYDQRADWVEVRPLFRQKLGSDAVGHEFFLQDGRIAAVWMRFAKKTDPKNAPTESYILVADPASGKHRAYRSPTMLYNHLHGRDGKLFVSEGISGRNGHGTLDLICRYDVRGNRADPTVLCAHGSSWNGQLAHPHPVLCRANRWCYFNSDREGRTNVYRVRMG